MADGTRRHKTMPDGMSERNEAIALEEYHSWDVEHATECQLEYTRLLLL